MTEAGRINLSLLHSGGPIMEKRNDEDDWIRSRMVWLDNNLSFVIHQILEKHDFGPLPNRIDFTMSSAACSVLEAAMRAYLLKIKKK